MNSQELLIEAFNNQEETLKVSGVHLISSEATLLEWLVSNSIVQPTSQIVTTVHLLEYMKHLPGFCPNLVYSAFAGEPFKVRGSFGGAPVATNALFFNKETLLVIDSCSNVTRKFYLCTDFKSYCKYATINFNNIW